MDVSDLRFERSDGHRVIVGVAGGFARRHGIDPLVVRGALVVLSFAAGLGVVLYAVGATLSSSPDPSSPSPTPTHPHDGRRDVSVALVTAGLLLVVRSTGLWMSDAVMVPIVVLVTGVVVLGIARGEHDASTTTLADVFEGRHARLRIGVGLSLLMVGLVLLGTGGRLSATVRIGLFAAALSVLGVALLLGPWIASLTHAAANERRQRIRAEEREAVAAHLHDSVLQTLALIQRTADDPRRTASLARQQEHELRAWLFGIDQRAVDSMAIAVRSMARDVEQRHDVRVDVVVVGDAAVDDGINALVAAMREACVNAAKHSGAIDVAVYVEASAGSVEGWVRDRGCGFDTLAPNVGHGIAQSIRGRVDRVGGEATITSSVGSGTEVHLSVPRSDRAASGVER